MNYFHDWSRTTERIEPTDGILKAFNDGLQAQAWIRERRLRRHIIHIDFRKSRRGSWQQVTVTCK